MSSKKKKLCAILLMLALVFMSQSKIFAENLIYFTDVNSQDWYYQPITRGAKNGLIYGYSDRTFKPNNDISLQEFLALYGRALVLIENKKEVSNIIQPEDFGISKSAWAYREIQNVLSRIDHNYLNKYNFNNINRPITREEVAFFINNSLILNTNTKTTSQLKDIGGTKFEADINNLEKHNIVLGYPDSNFKPEDHITRAELSKIIDNLY